MHRFNSDDDKHCQITNILENKKVFPPVFPGPRNEKTLNNLTIKPNNACRKSPKMRKSK